MSCGSLHVFFTLSARESYGEDIADTDTQRSDCSEDEYEDSFIDDNDLEIFPPSPIFCSGMAITYLV